jgi:hypothetical protein
MGNGSDDKSNVKCIDVEESSPSSVESRAVDNEHPQQTTVHGSTHHQIKGGQDVEVDGERIYNVAPETTPQSEPFIMVRSRKKKRIKAFCSESDVYEHPKEATFNGSTHHLTMGDQEVDLNKNSCLLRGSFESESGTSKCSHDAETLKPPEDVVACKKTNEQHEIYSNTTPNAGNRLGSSSTWNNHSNKEAIMISNTTGIEHSSVTNKIHYPEVSDHTETCVILHNQNPTMVYQTNNNLNRIPATIVDTSNDASYPQMVKVVIHSATDPSQEVKTQVDGGDHNKFVSGESAYRDNLLTKKQVGNQQNSEVDVISVHGCDAIPLEPSTLLVENTAEDYLEMSPSLHGVAVHNKSMETDDGGCLNEELELSILSLFPVPLPPAEYRLPELFPCAGYKRPKRWMFSTYDSNTKWSAPFVHDISTPFMASIHC